MIFRQANLLQTKNAALKIFLNRLTILQKLYWYQWKHELFLSSQMLHTRDMEIRPRHFEAQFVRAGNDLYDPPPPTGTEDH
jgi:hypothetical protein